MDLFQTAEFPGGHADEPAKNLGKITQNPLTMRRKNVIINITNKTNITTMKHDKVQ